MNSVSHSGVFSLVLLATASSSAGEISADAFHRARSQLQAGIQSGAVAGGSHMVVHQGRTVYFETAGLRDIETQQAFRKDTILRIYSMTKPVTSVAAMMLYEQGKFQLDDPVSRYIPAFANTTVLEQDGDAVRIVPANRPITIRDVFRHTTGYSYGDGKPSPRAYYERAGLRYRPPAAMLPPEMSIARAATALAGIPALHHPGQRFTYGFSTDLLGRLIEIWSGRPLDQYLQQAVFKPLHMVDTGFSIPQEKRSRFASCHTWKDDTLAIIDKAPASQFNTGFTFLSGGGGLLSTVPDYGRFCQMLVSYGKFQGQTILKEDTVRLMFTDQLNGVAGDFQFGLGFAIADVPAGPTGQQRQVRQYSWGGYASTDFRLVPDEQLFQIVARQRIPSSHGLARRLFPVIYQGLPTP